MRRLLLALATLTAGCFSPDYAANLKCEPNTNKCPSGRTCNLATGICEGAIDAAVGDGEMPDGGPLTDGDLVDAPIDGPPESDGPCEGDMYPFAVSNLRRCDVPAPAAPLTLSSAGQFTYDTTTGTGGSVTGDGGVQPLPVPPSSLVLSTDGRLLRVMAASSVTIVGGATVQVTGMYPLVIVSRGDITVNGNLDVGGHGTVAGAGARSAALCAGEAGMAGRSEAGRSGGGGGGAHRTPGGSGGMGEAAPGGMGGMVAGTFASTPLTKLRGGCPGGNGGASGGMMGGPGGGAGGAIQLSSAGTITIGGFISASGGGGLRGTPMDQGTGGGGGGSGGTVLVEGNRVIGGGAAGNGALTANGGGGGAGTMDDNIIIIGDVHSTNGSDGSRTMAAANGGSNGSPGGVLMFVQGNGGNGGFGSPAAAGVDGREQGMASFGGDSAAIGGGGGGGGAGVIVVRAVVSAALDATVRSPDELRTGTQPCTAWSFMPSNGIDPCGLHVPQPIGDITVSTVGATLSTTGPTGPSGLGGGMGLGYVTLTGGRRVRVIVARNFTNQVALRAMGFDPVVLVVHGNATLAAGSALDLSNNGAGIGSSTDCTVGGQAGGGAPTATQGGGGGGGGGFGGDGAAGAQGGGGGGAAGAPRSAFGMPSLEPLSGGCQGGQGGASSAAGGGRGAAGGAVQISARDRLQIDGEIHAEGGGGGGGAAVAGVTNGAGGGGGGSGGGILLESMVVDVRATGRLCANGGSGGQGSLVTVAGAPGNTGTCVRTSGATTAPVAGAGGNGGRGGFATSVNGGAGSNPAGQAGGGGGGGGVGRIRIRVPAAGTKTVNASAVITPTEAP